jgi:hypothetical protein
VGFVVVEFSGAAGNLGSWRREMDSNFRFLVGSTPPRCAPR